MQNMNSNDLSKLSPKILKGYINAYNLPIKSAIEKSDLVKIIFNTRPISNENESYYRRARTKSTAKSTNSDSFSFSNMVQDLFSSSSSDQEQQQQQQQQQQKRRQQEQHRQQEQYRQQEQNRQRQQQQQQEQLRRQQEQANRERNERQQREHLQAQRQQEQQQRASPASESLLSLHDMIKANINPASLSVRTLKSILKANFVEHSHVIEKSDLVKLVQRLVDQQQAEAKNENNSNEDTLCRVCYDAQQNCVFLDCGHMVTCMDCAKKLIETKNECPICREPILKLVHVFRS